MSEQVCLKQKINHCQFWVNYFTVEIARRTLFPADVRGHKVNERIRKLEVKRDLFAMHLKTLKFNELETDHYHIDKISPVEIIPEIETPEPNQQDSAYLL